MKRKIFSLGLALVLGWTVAACNNQASPGGDGEDPGEPVDGGKVTMSMFSAPKGIFNPVFYEDQYDVYPLHYTFEDLWYYDKDLRLTIPGLAEKWEFSDDNQTLTIHLRKNAKWHDGEPITVDDLIFAWETIAHPDYTGSRLYMVEKIKGAEAMHEGEADELSGVEKVDDYTVKVTFEQAAANTLANLWATPIPKHVYEGMNPKEMVKADATKKKPIGSGPFQFKEIKPNEYVVLERNPDYYGENAHLDQIVWKVVSQDVAIGALENGEIDFLTQIAPEEFESLKKNENLTVKETQDFAYQYMGFNLTKEKLQDKKLRQAITYGINRKAMVDGLLKGHGTVLNQHMPQASWAYNEELKDAYPYDPEKAKKILKEAGYEDKDGDNFVEDPEGNPLTLTLSYPTGNPVREKSAPVIVQDLKKIGLNVKLDQPAEQGVFYEKVEKAEYELFLAGWSLTPDPDPSGIWMSTDQWNFPRWENEKSDELIKKAVLSKEAIEDQEKRKQIYAEWTELVSEEAPYVFLYSMNRIEAWNNRVKGVTFDWRGAIEDHNWVNEWWIPKDQQ
ncbi:peptide-binding protein [Paludifilum halophilum]|nr:peptide-binding protein [Paludifilum halophilum]